jgi:hypothetical protein
MEPKRESISELEFWSTSQDGGNSLGANGGEWSASPSTRFTAAALWTGGWMGSRVSQEAQETIDYNLLSLPEIEPKLLGRPARSFATISTEVTRLGQYW